MSTARKVWLAFFALLIGVLYFLGSGPSDGHPKKKVDSSPVYSALAESPLDEISALRASRSRPTIIAKDPVKPKVIISKVKPKHRAHPHVASRSRFQGDTSSSYAWAHTHDAIGVANCESGPGHRHPKYDVYVGDIRQVSNIYYGKWQFSRSTWRSVGGSGSPAAASETEQDYRAWLLWKSRGWQPWQCAGQLGIG